MKSSTLFDNLNSSTTISYTPSHQTTLTACHLVELAYDVQTVIIEQPAINSSPYVPIHNILSATLAVDITRQIQSTRANFGKINDLLHSFEQVSPAASQIVQQWLLYNKDELKILTYHAALLLAYSNIWSVLGMNILCDLLLNKIDRFRQRAEFILRSKSLPWRTSQLGSDVFSALIEKDRLFMTTSPYASLITCWAFEKTQVDDIDHLSELMACEKSRLETVLKNTTSDNKKIQNTYRYMHVLSAVSTPVLCHFIKIVEEEVDNIVKAETEGSSVEAQIMYVEHLLDATGLYSRTTVTQDKIFLDMCTRILKNDLIHIRIRQATVFALGYCGQESLSILQAEILKSSSAAFLPITLCSYCRCLSQYYDSMTELEKTAAKNSLELVIGFLTNSSNEVSQAAADGLARVYAPWDDGLNVLLTCLNHDQIRAFSALLNATKDLYINTQTRTTRVAELIEQYSSSLLPLFILELFQSIENFDSSIYLRPDIVGFRGNIETVQVAADLTQKMPAAFCAEVNRSEFGEKIKRALFYASKQHDFPRRAACVAVLSAFGDLTPDMCDMFTTALLDSPWSQTVAYECVSRIQQASDSNVIPTLFSYMSSESLIARYTIAKLLVRLQQQGVVSVNKVQEVLSEAIKDQFSHQNLWICIATTIDFNSDQIYEHAGRFGRLLYAMLIEMSFGISKLLSNNSLLSTTNHQSLMEYDFQRANIPSYHSPFNRINGLKQFPIVAEYILGSRHETDWYADNIHQYMLPLLYQSLWWKQERAMTFPSDIRESLIKLYGLAEKNNMDAAELVAYAMQNTENESNEEGETVNVSDDTL